MAYKYITKNNLYDKQTYMYSEYGGRIFLEEYLDSRKDYLEKVDQGEAANRVRRELSEIYWELETGKNKENAMEILKAYTKSFEVRKRLYTGYDENWRPEMGTGFEDYVNYLLFGNCLCLAYRNTRCLKYFSCLLKVDDTLLSVQDKLNGMEKECLCRLVRAELDLFLGLADETGTDWEGLYGIE